MNFPDLSQVKEKLVQTLIDQKGVGPAAIRVVASPYRICPLGAHIDHQGGPVLGMTIEAYTFLAYVPSEQGGIELSSENYPGAISFALDSVPESVEIHWGQYVRAAVLALKEKYPLQRGLIGLVDGMLPGCGLSSSASVLLAYLSALAEANRISLSPWDLVSLTRRAENHYLGLQNGILDQASIVFGKKDHLLYIDTKAETVSPLPAPPVWRDYRILIAFSGYRRELTTSHFNSRVQECQEAAHRLSSQQGGPAVQILSDIPAEVFERYREQLPDSLRRRAEHFFNEVIRVQQGLFFWKEGRMAEFAGLMNETCISSMEKYECGIPAICDLQQMVSSTPGIIGSRFMGGGFGGCVVGLVKTEQAESALETIQNAYRKQHPEVADQTRVFLTRSADGVCFV
ncbi:MAG: galactokinase family protein [Thermodesulfobacteriota bacterium]